MAVEPQIGDIRPLSGFLPTFVEAAVAVLAIGLALFMALVQPDIGIASRAMAIGVGLLAAWIAWQDWRSFTIPDGAVVALAALAIGYRWAVAMQAGDAPLEAMAPLAIDAVLPGGLLLAFREVYFRRRGFDGIGLGDVKLAAAGAVLVGTIGFSWALLAASLTGLVVFGARRLFARSAAGPFDAERIAFGALLAPAFWMVWVGQTMAVLLPVAWG